MKTIFIVILMFLVNCEKDNISFDNVKKLNDSINLEKIFIAKWYNNYNFAIAMSWDDTNPTHYTDVAPVFDSFNFKTTFNIITAWGKYPLYKELAEKGHEIGSHSVHHLNFNTVDSATIDYELRQSKADIIKNIGVIPTTFSQPFANFPAQYNYLIYKYYLFAKRNDYDIDTEAIYYNILSSSTFDKLKSKADQASQDSTVIIYIGHSVDNSGWEPIPRRELKLFLKYIKEESNAWLTTIKDIGLYSHVRNKVSISYSNNVVNVDVSKIDYEKYASFEIKRLPITIVILSDKNLQFIGQNILTTNYIKCKYIVSIDLLIGNSFEIEEIKDIHVLQRN